MKRKEQKLAIDAAAQGLAPELLTPFRALAFDLNSHRGRWGLFLLKFEHAKEQEQVSAAVKRFLPNVVMVDALKYTSWPELEAALSIVAKDCAAIELINLDEWLDEYPDPAQAAGRLRAWNIRREGYAAAVTVPLLCWLRPERMRALANNAPDLWSWRTGVYEFELAGERAVAHTFPEIKMWDSEIDNRTGAERRQRIADIEQYLARTNDAPDSAIQMRLLDELADLHISLAAYEQALLVLRIRLMPMCEKLADEFLVARARCRIGEVLSKQGQLDEAIAIFREASLVFEKQGQIHEFAVASGKIADILYSRGDWDDALHIYRDQEMPLYEKMGNVRAQTITKGKISLISSMKGDGEHALRMLREEVIPVFETIGDVLEQAIATDQIASILYGQGKFDDALHILREQIPAYEKLGAAYQLVRARTNLAITLMSRNHGTDKTNARQTLMLALAEAQRLGLPREVAIIERWIRNLELM